MSMRVLILDDHPVLRCAVRGIIQDLYPAAIPIEAATAHAALCIVKAQPVVLAILDMMLPDQSGLTVLRKIKLLHPQTKCLMLTIRDELWNVRLAMAHGASGYVVKGLPVEALSNAIQKVMAGGVSIPDEATLRPQSGVRVPGAALQQPPLSVREIEVLVLLANGRTVSQISKQMKLSVKTVSTYRVRLLNKLSLKTTADLIRYAIDHGLIG